MPELPEVEFARGCLERWLGGTTLARVEADAGRVIRGTSREAFARLSGRRVRAIERRGKWLLWRFDSDLGLLAHLGMTGKFELQQPDASDVRWSRVRFVLPDGAVVHYRDPRKFGRLVVAPLATLLSKGPLADLGPDAHEPRLTARALGDRIGKSRRPIKDVLMDQTVVAGLGNIQVTDALFLARLHPRSRADALTSADTVQLAKAIHTSLQKTLKMNRGDKITYVDDPGKPPTDPLGNTRRGGGKTKRIENPFLVYGKAGSPCPRCRHVLKKMVISGRTTAYCSRCQKKPER
jgi:formamidopyrimidine-DNA glycosylase